MENERKKRKEDSIISEKDKLKVRTNFCINNKHSIRMAMHSKATGGVKVCSVQVQKKQKVMQKPMKTA